MREFSFPVRPKAARLPARSSRTPQTPFDHAPEIHLRAAKLFRRRLYAAKFTQRNNTARITLRGQTLHQRTHNGDMVLFVGNKKVNHTTVVSRQWSVKISSVVSRLHISTRSDSNGLLFY